MTEAASSFLRYTDDTGRQHELPLVPAQQRFTIGRNVQADLVLGWDAEVSRLHAAIEHLGTHWTIIDDGLSRNGTFVNGERLIGRRRLSPGDRIRVGTTLVHFFDFGGVVDDATHAAAAAIPTMRSLTDTQRAVLVALCRPYKHGTGFATPASNQQIAEELFLSIDAIKTHLRALFAKFGVENLPQNQKRTRLAALAMQSGMISDHDL